MKDVVIDNVIKSQLVEDYFDYFESRDISALSDMFADDICLSDWRNETVEGKEAVLNVIRVLYRDTPTQFAVNINHLYEDPDAILADVHISFTEAAASTRIIDVIKFNKDGLINSIEGFLGFQKSEK